MNWTVGIITSGDQWHRIHDICLSLMRQSKNREIQIIVCGGENYWSNRIIPGAFHHRFDEKTKPNWITKKKNLIAQFANYDNICLIHDYISFNPYWIEGFETFGDNWLTCINPIKNMDSSRFRDLCEIYNDSWMEPPIDDTKPPENLDGKLIDYDKIPNPRWQYYSGAYGCYKKKVLLSVPFDESRVWGQGEDVQHSRLLYQKYGPDIFSFNPFSEVRFLKQKERAPWEK